MKRFREILYVHDETSEVAEETLRLALELAKRNDGRVDLITILEPPPAFFTLNASVVLRSHWQEESEEELKELAQSVSPNRKLKTKLIEGKPHIQAIREVLQHDYDLLIKPIGPSAFVDRLLGSLDMQLLRHCPCPVWLSKGEMYGAFDQILAAVDAEFEVYGGGKADTEEAEDLLNRQILELAFSLAADNKAQLHIGHAWYPPFLSRNRRALASISKKEIDDYIHTLEREHTNWLKRLMKRASVWVGKKIAAKVRFTTHLRQGSGGTELPKLISELKADVLIMGTVARSGVSGLVMGNTAETILDQVTCSVLAVKPSGFVSTVTLGD